MKDKTVLILYLFIFIVGFLIMGIAFLNANAEYKAQQVIATEICEQFNSLANVTNDATTLLSYYDNKSYQKIGTYKDCEGLKFNG